MWISVFPGLIQLCIYFAVTKGQSSKEFAFGRTFYLNPARLTWKEAERECWELNGTLATVYSLTTIGSLDLQGDWTFWIGLHQDHPDNWTWTSGMETGWTNWNFGLKSVNEEVPSCVAAVNRYPNWWWLPLNCTEQLASLCEVKQGDCRYEVYRGSSLVSHNRQLKEQVDVEDCKKLCDSTTQFTCRSFEYHSSGKFCQLSDSNHVLFPGDFIRYDLDWDYYHRTCNTGGTMNASSVSPYEFIFPTPTLESSSFYISTTEIISSTEWSNKLTICREIDLTSRPPNETIPEEIKELQELQTVFKERQLTLKKTSVPDPRTSSTFIGSTAVIVAFSCLGLIVVADIITFPTHFKNVQRQAYLNSRRRSRKKREKLREKEIEEKGPIVIGPRSNGTIAPTDGASIIAARNRLLSTIVPPKADDITVDKHTTASNMQDSGFVGFECLELQPPDDTSSGAYSEDLSLETGDNPTVFKGENLTELITADDINVGDNWTLRRHTKNPHKSMNFIYDGNGVITTQL